MTKTKTLRYVCAAAVVLLVFALCRLFPLISDDWYREALGRSLHGLSDLISIIKTKWQTNNPRVLGNVLAYISGGRPVIRWLLRSLFFSAVILLGTKAAGLETPAGLLLMASAVVAIPREMFGQIYPWGAGFFNYVPPAVLTLAAFCLLRPVLTQEVRGGDGARAAALLLLGFCAQLFVENNTLCAVFAGLTLAVWQVRRMRRLSLSTAAYVLGTILGALAMFLSPAYRAFTQQGEAYSLGGGTSLPMRLAINTRQICYHMIVNAPVIVVGLTVLLLLTLRFGKQRRTPADTLLAAAVTILCAVLLMCRFGRLPALCSVVSAVLWYLLAGRALARWMKPGLLRSRALFYWLVALAAAAPLLVVQPIGSRCLYLSYLFLLIVCGILLKDLFAERKPAPVLLLPAAALICAVFGFYFSTFLPIHAAEQARIAAIESAMNAGEAQVVIPAFPYQDFLWNPDIAIGKQYYYVEPDDFLILVENTGA